MMDNGTHLDRDAGQAHGERDVETVGHPAPAIPNSETSCVPNSRGPNAQSDLLHETLRRFFGYDTFRGRQEEVMRLLCGGRDVVLVMPTGAGKSLCYQLPSIIRDGMGLVISPLISLMQNQVSALKQAGVRVASLNSSLSRVEQSAVAQGIRDGTLDLLYLAPERLLREDTLALIRQTRLSLVAIDEAHCVSQWGHDFRPEYLRLGELAEVFKGVPRIALTATADERMRKEIVLRLKLRAPEIVVTGFDRPSIRYSITQKVRPRDQLLRFLEERHPEDTGIVYRMTRKKVEETAAWLNESGRLALPYHAGLSDTVRKNNLNRFLAEDNVIVVATIAFGMGIDKPDVRFVAHLDLPKSVECYFQETGRAGRDGLPADAWMAYGLQDVVLLRQWVEASGASDAHKRLEHYRLNSIIGLCEIASCRRQSLLRYFGEELPGPCDNCDNCLEPAEQWEGTEAAQKALSAVVRTGQRFGMAHLIDILLGEGTERVLRLGHDRLKTFGVGKEHGKPQWQSVFRQLLMRGYLTTDLDGFGSLHLTQRGWSLLKGGERIHFRQDKSGRGLTKGDRCRKKIAVPALEKSHVTPDLWDALRALRREIAAQEGIPAYRIFHDSTLREMAARRPRDQEGLRDILGVGDHKLARYGQAFLNLIANSN